MSAPCSFCEIEPTFKVNNWDNVNLILEEFMEATKKEPGNIYYGFVVNKETNTFFCREAYVDGDAINTHLENVTPLLGKLLDGPAELVSLHLKGPEEEVAKFKPGTDPLGAVYTYVAEPGFTNIPADKITGTEDLPNTFCTILPTFSVTDWPKAEKEIMEVLTKSTNEEEGCIFYGWTLNKEDNKLVCREAYVDGNAVNAHLTNSLPVLGPALESGLLKLESLVIAGPADQLEMTKELCDPLGAVYHETMNGFSRFSM